MNNAGLGVYINPLPAVLGADNRHPDLHAAVLLPAGQLPGALAVCQHIVVQHEVPLGTIQIIY